MVTQKAGNSALFIFIIFAVFAHILIAANSANDLVKKGLRANELQQQIEYFQKATEVDPSHMMAWFHLGKAKNRLGNGEEAENALQRALRLSPDNIDSQIKAELIQELAEAYTQQGKYEEALQSQLYLLTLIDDPHNRALIFSAIGESYTQLGKYERAMDAFNQAVSIEPIISALIDESVQYARKMHANQKLIEHGDSLINVGNYKAALHIYTRLDSMMPGNDQIRAKIQEMRQLLSQQPERTSPDASIAMQKGDTTRTIRRDHSVPVQRDIEAVPVDEIELIDPKADSLFNLAERYINNDDWTGARKILLDLKNTYPNDSRADRRLKEVEMTLQTADKLQTVTTYYMEGSERMKYKDWFGAIISFEKAKVLYPDYRDIDSLLEVAKNNLIEQQRKMLLAAESVQPVQPSSHHDWYVVGIVLSALFVPFILAVIISPEVRARIYMLQGNYYRACQLYERMIKRHPEKTRVYITLANIYLMKQRTDEQALKIYVNALQAELDMATKTKIAALVESEKEKSNGMVSADMQQIVDALKEDIHKLGQ